MTRMRSSVSPLPQGRVAMAGALAQTATLRLAVAADTFRSAAAFGRVGAVPYSGGVPARPIG